MDSFLPFSPQPPLLPPAVLGYPRTLDVSFPRGEPGCFLLVSMAFMLVSLNLTVVGRIRERLSVLLEVLPLSVSRAPSGQVWIFGPRSWVDSI